MTIERGEVWWAETPESSKGRPLLVLTRNEAIPVLRTLLVAPISRTIGRIPTEVPLGLSEGLPVVRGDVRIRAHGPEVDARSQDGCPRAGSPRRACEAFAAAVDC
ncbi:MAG TPA: type II toxin-antitoxin system PemK/MazF family toxin [Actinomycetota bacterium]|nr:type II toxin-antitoxin system PemK/MazF family toxin [Actinomycetota bacterium]